MMYVIIVILMYISMYILIYTCLYTAAACGFFFGFSKFFQGLYVQKYPTQSHQKLTQSVAFLQSKPFLQNRDSTCFLTGPTKGFLELVAAEAITFSALWGTLSPTAYQEGNYTEWLLCPDYGTFWKTIHRFDQVQGLLDDGRLAGIH